MYASIQPMKRKLSRRDFAPIRRGYTAFPRSFIESPSQSRTRREEERADGHLSKRSVWVGACSPPSLHCLLCPQTNYERFCVLLVAESAVYAAIPGAFLQSDGHWR
jgi:hypothetical protein